MKVFGTLILASAVLLNYIEFSIQVGPTGSSPSPPPTAKGPAKPPPKPPGQPPPKKPKLAKGASSSTSEPPEHPERSHPAPQPGSTPHPGSSSANPAPAPGAPPSTTNKGGRTPTKHNPKLGSWPRILKRVTQPGLAKAPLMPTGYIRLDANYKILETTLDKLGFVRLTIKGYPGVELKFRKYTFFPDQNLLLFLDININQATMIPDAEHIVIVNAEDYALAILMPNGFILGVYVASPRARKKVHTINNDVKDFEGDEKEHVFVGLKYKIPGSRYEVHQNEINSLLHSYGRKGGGGLTPSTYIEPKKHGRPRLQPKQNP